MISAIIVAKNAEKYIIPCIKSIINQFDISDNWELIIVDGISSDNTKNLAISYLQNMNVKYSIIDNPHELLASGWNMGIKVAKGEFVVRPDAHAELLDGYIKNGVEILNNYPDLVGVGGTLITVSDSNIGNLIATVLGNPVGVGRSLFRTGVSENTYTETAVYAVYRKKLFNEIGYFNEELSRNQDIDMHQRILKSGYKLITAANMKANYYSRTSISKFVKQGYYNGFWVFKSNAYHLNHLIPMCFVLSILVLVLLSIKLTGLFLFVYFILVMIAYLLFSKVYNILKLPLLGLLTFTLHCSYGVGTIIGGVSRLLKL